MVYQYQSTEVAIILTQNTRKLPIFDFCLQWYGIYCHGNQVYEFAKRFIVGLCNSCFIPIMVWYINISLLKLR